jgi:hypothetical protein
MALYTETEINKEIWENREYITGHNYPSDLAHEYADSAVPIYTANIQLDWADLDFEHQNRWKETGMENPETIEDLQKIDIYMYYSDLYSAAIYELTENGKILVDGEWTDKPEED